MLAGRGMGNGVVGRVEMSLVQMSTLVYEEGGGVWWALCESFHGTNGRWDNTGRCDGLRARGPRRGGAGIEVDVRRV